MTTSSGKPPIDEHAVDSSWESPEAVEPEADLLEASSADDAEDEPVYGVGVPYGGNDRTEEVEPIALDMPFSPEDVLTPPVVTPRRALTPRSPSPANRDAELKAPVAQLVLSDLFDSTPPPPGSSMEPPDPAAFSTSRPPAGKLLRRNKARDAADSDPPLTGSPWGLSLPGADSKYLAGGPPAAAPVAAAPAAAAPAAPAPAAARSSPPRASAPGAASARSYPAGAPMRSGFPGGSESPSRPHPAAARGAEPITSGGVVALPSINVLAETPFPRPEPQRPRASEAPPERPAAEALPAPAAEPPPAVAAEASPEPAPSAAQEAAGVFPSAGLPSSAQPSSPDAAGQRRNVPTLESVGNAATRPKRSAASGKAGRDARTRQAAGNEAPRFPSEIPTSRPPDVLLASDTPAAPEAQPSERKSSRSSRARSSAPPAERRSSNPPPQSVLASLPSTKTGQIALPSVMLADDVEAEPDSATLRRSQRAARATVRIELPEGFGRPGSPLFPGLPRGTSSALPVSEREVTFRGLPMRRLLPWAVAGVLLLAACLVLVLRPRSGSLVVTALGSGHRAVQSVQIFVDGTPLCDASPCRISGLAPGSHRLRAIAPGLSSGEDQVLEIRAGEEAAANIELAATEPDVQAGSVRVPAGETDLTLFVDDRRVGKLPQTVSGLAVGKHWIKLDAEDGSAPIEKAVNVLPGEIIDVDPTPAKRDKVVVTIRLSPDSEGASVTLDDAFLLDFPAELELDPRSTHHLSATKPGYEDFALRIDLGDEGEKLVEVALTPLEGANVPRPRPRPAPAAASAPVLRKAPAASKPPASALGADPSQGLLNISSVPPSQIILNGRPLGSTPKTAVVVPGDSLQTIVFVHQKMGRRRAQKFVPAGKERTVSIRF